MSRVIADLGHLGGTGTTLSIDGSVFSQVSFHVDADMAIAVSNVALGERLLIEIVNSGSSRTLTWSGVTIWNGSSAPSTIGSGKVLVLELIGLVASDISEAWRIVT